MLFSDWNFGAVFFGHIGLAKTAQSLPILEKISTIYICAALCGDGYETAQMRRKGRMWGASVLIR